MKKKILGIFVVMLLISCTSAPAIDLNFKKEKQMENKPSITNTPILPSGVTFIKTFGGVMDDLGYCVQQTTDGGYIIAGPTYSFGSGGSDVWLIKTDSSGNKEWEKTHGGANHDRGFSVRQTTDGGYIIVGETFSYGAGICDVWLIKTNGAGNKEWDKTFGGSDYDVGWCVSQTTDGGYIITGLSWSEGAGLNDLWLIKTDSSGNKEWDKTFGGKNFEEGECVQEINGGGYIVTGYTYSFGSGGSDLWLIKTDSTGNKIWEKTFGGADTEVGRYVQQTTDSGYIITGTTKSFGAGKHDVWLIKTDSSGNKEWDETFGGADYDNGECVCQTTDSGYIITGDTYSFGEGENDLLLIKTDSSGNKEWDKTFGGTKEDGAYYVQQTSDEGFIITGKTNSFGPGISDVWLIKTDKDGKTINKAITSSFFVWFLERYLNEFQVLRQLLGV